MAATVPRDGRLDARSVRQQMSTLAARGLSNYALLFGGLLTLASALQWAAGGPGMAGERLLLGLAIGGGGAIGWWLVGRDRPRAAAATVLLTMAVGLASHAWAIGLGIHSIAIAGITLLLALAGMIVGVPAALGLTAVYALIVGALAWGEAAGLLAGREMLARLSFADRLIGLALLGGSALLAAVLLHRLIGRVVLRAITEQQRLTELLMIGVDWSFEMDERGRVVYISPSFEQHTGRRIDEFLRTGEPGGPVLEDDDGWRAVRAAMRERLPYRDQVVTFRCADGTLLHVRGNGNPMFDADGSFLGYQGVSRNVSAERAALREQQRAQAMLDRVVKMSPDAIFVARDDGLILMANAGFLEMAGRREDEVIGRYAGHLGMWAGSELLRLREAIIADGSVRDFRIEARDARGRRRLLALSAGQFEWDGAPVAVLIARDITDAEQARLELADAKQQAEAANEAKSAFLATMSHEIRTPLAGVLGLARLLQDPALPPQRRLEYVAHLVGAAEQLSGIVSDVLDLSKIEAGHLQFEHIGFDLHELVASGFSSFARLGQERGLVMHCSVAPQVPRRVLGDPVRVRQILANYLGNALKFTARGSIELSVGPAAGERVRFAVSDSGIGVAPALRERLFRPFVQADGSTTRRFGGTGLGLSICRELAERMQGSVGVDSDGHSGSVFWAELRLPAETAPRDATLAAASAGRRPLLGLRVLVAEDNPVNLLIVGAMLERLGAEMVSAHDGERAVEMALDGSESISVVLMDLHMPALDGLAATRRLRADPRTAALPIFALSAAVLDNERQEAGAAGMDGFISKPVSEPELLRLLQPLAQR